MRCIFSDKNKQTFRKYLINANWPGIYNRDSVDEQFDWFFGIVKNGSKDKGSIHELKNYRYVCI